MKSESWPYISPERPDFGSVSTDLMKAAASLIWRRDRSRRGIWPCGANRKDLIWFAERCVLIQAKLGATAFGDGRRPKEWQDAHQRKLRIRPLTASPVLRVCASALLPTVAMAKPITTIEIACLNTIRKLLPINPEPL